MYMRFNEKNMQNKVYMSSQGQAFKITSNYNCNIVILQSNAIIKRCQDFCI